MDMTVEVPELPELTFDEASHIYRLNGDIIPSVSKLMEPLKDQCYGGISKRTLENAAIKGSAVHNSIENWIKFGIDDIPSEHRGYAATCSVPIWSWMWRRLTEREPTWRRTPSMPSGTPSGRCRMTSTVWLEIAEWWMPSTPSTMFGGALAP